MHRLWHSRWERFYSKSHWHLVLDLSLLIVIIMLFAMLVGLHVYRPNLSWFGGPVGPAIDLNNPPLALDYSIANPILKDNNVILKIAYKNNGTAIVNNTTIDFLMTDKKFALDHLEIVSGGDQATVSGRELVLTPVAADGSGEVEVKAYFTPQDPTARQVSWEAQDAYNFAGQLIKTANTLPPVTSTAELTVNNDIYYTSPQGDQLGIGPVPPIVGVPTSYWVFWKVKSNGNFQNLVFSAYLPKGVELGSGRSPITGDFSYNPTARQVVWKLPALESQNDNYNLGFEIQLTPTATQVGQVLPLLTKTRYYAEDTLTGQATSSQMTDLTTNLETDHFNAGQGKVVNQ